MYAMSLSRLYMHVVPVLDIRGMLLICPPSLNHIFKSDWSLMHEHQVMTQQMHVFKWLDKYTSLNTIIV